MTDQTHNVHPLVQLDDQILCLAIPQEITDQDEIRSRLQKAQGWLKDMHQRTHGLDQAMAAMRAGLAAGQTGTPESQAPTSPALTSPGSPAAPGSPIHTEGVVSTPEGD